MAYSLLSWVIRFSTSEPSEPKNAILQRDMEMCMPSRLPWQADSGCPADPVKKVEAALLDDLLRSSHRGGGTLRVPVSLASLHLSRDGR